MQEIFTKMQVNENMLTMVVRDGESTMVSLASKLGKPTFQCFAHALQLVSFIIDCFLSLLTGSQGELEFIY